MELVKIMFRSLLLTNIESTETYFLTLENIGGRLLLTALLLMIILDGYGLFPRVAISAAAIATTMTGCARFVSFLLRSLNQNRSRKWQIAN